MKFKKIMSGFLAAVSASVLLSGISVSAEPSKLSNAQDDYVFVPTVSGAKAKALLSTSASGVTIGDYNSEDKSIAITFPAGVKAEGSDSVTRTASEVTLDMSSLYDEGLKYVSFDLSTSELMDFVASMNKSDATGDKPFSLYLADNGYMGGMEHSRKDYYATQDRSNILKDAMKNWYFNNKFTIKYNANEYHNVKMLRDLKTGNVWVYIDGIQIGNIEGKAVKLEDISSTWLTNAKNKSLFLTHYATAENKQIVTLKNLEIGKCYDYGYHGGMKEGCQYNASNSKYWLSNAGDFKGSTIDNNRVFARFTMPASKDKYTLECGNITVAWLGKDKGCGICDGRNDRSITEVDAAKNVEYDRIDSWGNIPAWKAPEDKESIVITFELDKTDPDNQIVRAFTECGGVYEKNVGNFVNAGIVTLTVAKSDTASSDKNSAGTYSENQLTVAPLSVDYGFVVPVGLDVVIDKGASISEFVENEEYYVTTFNNASDKEVVIYAWYDANDRLLDAGQKECNDKDDSSQGKILSTRNVLKTTAPANAAKLRVYLWDSVSGLKPVWKSMEILKAIEAAE